MISWRSGSKQNEHILTWNFQFSIRSRKQKRLHYRYTFEADLWKQKLFYKYLYLRLRAISTRYNVVLNILLCSLFICKIIENFVLITCNTILSMVFLFILFIQFLFIVGMKDTFNIFLTKEWTQLRWCLRLYIFE